jgi:hypothetical protein
MVSNLILKAGAAVRVAAGLVSLTLLAACSWLGHAQQEPVSSSVAAPIASVGTGGEATAPQTVTDQLGEAGTTTVIGDATPVLNGSAPMSYTVRRGDTLWGIAGLFLRDPWLWPEIWYVNPQVENPHRIYPGDVLRLATGADGRTQLQLVRGPATRLAPLLRSAQLEGPIATIPYSAIASFLSRPGVLSREQVKAAPYIQALRDEHMIAGTGHAVYVKKLAGGIGERYSVMHVGDPLKDPESHDVLGYMGIYTATAQLTRSGDPATATLSDTTRETLRGDVLITDTSPGAPCKRADHGDRQRRAACRTISGGGAQPRFQPRHRARPRAAGAGKPARGQRSLRAHRRQWHLPPLRQGETADRDRRAPDGIQDLPAHELRAGAGRDGADPYRRSRDEPVEVQRHFGSD